MQNVHLDHEFAWINAKMLNIKANIREVVRYRLGIL